MISKKELLSETGISYGQLYRWKREHLIPEEWFVKQSSYTGQETFLPKDKILERIHAILELKDQYSLEDMARLLSPESVDSPIPADSLEKIEEIDRELLRHTVASGRDQLDFRETVFLAAVSKTAAAHRLGVEQTDVVLQKGLSMLSGLKNTSLNIIFFLAGGELHLALSGAAVRFDDTVEVLDTHSLDELSSSLKVKYKTLFTNV